MIRARLRRDELIAAEFLYDVRECSGGAESDTVRAAEGYMRWCTDARLGLLYAESPIDLNAFEQEWRARADTSSILAPNLRARFGVMLLLLMSCVLGGVGNYVASVVIAVVAITAYIIGRKAKPTLLVGPTGRFRC